MNEKVLVEFIANSEDRELLIYKLRSIDYELVNTDIDYDDDQDGLSETWYKVLVKISATDTTAIKLQDQFLAERMYVSYIPNNLKDKHRK